MTESESMYYLHTCLSHISIQPLLAFVGTTINKLIPGTSFNPYLAKWSRSVQGVVHDQRVVLEVHLNWAPWPKGRPCWIILDLVEIKQHQSLKWHHHAQGCSCCSAQPSKELVPHGELLSPPTCGSPPDPDSLSVLLAWDLRLLPVGSGKLMLLFKELWCLKIL